jgi:hypothetical protein
LRRDRPDWNNLHRLSVGVLRAQKAALGDERALAIWRPLVQASFHFRSAEIGTRMFKAPGSFSPELVGDEQVGQFAGASLAATSFASVVDLCAAAIHRFCIPEPAVRRRSDEGN